MSPLHEFLSNIKLNQIYESDEATLKQTVILRIFSLLGWDIFNSREVSPEYSVGGNNVDYALCLKGNPKIFIEVKRPKEELGDHQEQLLKYAFTSGIELATLTNGVSWWFYLPLQKGSWENRKFDALDLSKDEPSDFSEKITNYLSKSQVSSNKSLEAASIKIKELNETKIISEAFPKAWSIIVNEDNQDFRELLNKKIEEICGYRTSKEKLVEHIRSWKLMSRTHTQQIEGSITQPHAFRTPHRIGSSTSLNYWLIPFFDPGSLIQLVIEEKIWAIGEKTPGRKGLKPGDWACFYLSKKGVVAHAQVASSPTYLKHPKVKNPDKYPWVFQLTDVKVYDKTPVVLDNSLLANLEAFKDRPPDSSWGWFVQSNHRISEKDFKLLTR